MFRQIDIKSSDWLKFWPRHRRLFFILCSFVLTLNHNITRKPQKKSAGRFFKQLHSKYGINSLYGRKTPQIDRMLALMKDRQRRIRHESMLHFLKVVLLWQAVVGVSLFFLRWLVLRLSSIILPAFYLLKNTLIWKEGCLFKHAKKLYCSRLFVGILELPRLQKLMLLISLPLKYFIISSCNTVL